MRKHLFFLIGGLFAVLFASAQSDTVRMDRLQLVFPGKAQVDEQGNNKRFQLRLADSSANFMMVSVDMTAMGMDESMVVMMQASPEFWEQTREGMVGQMGGDAKLIKDEMLDWNGTKMMQLQLERPSKEGGVNRLIVRMFFLGTNMIQYGHTNRNDKADAAIREAFLSSLQIK